MPNDNFFPGVSPVVVEARDAGPIVEEQWWQIGCIAHARHTEKVLLHEEDILALLAEGKVEGAQCALQNMEARMERAYQTYLDVRHLGGTRVEFDRVIEDPQGEASRALQRARKALQRAQARAAALVHFGLS